MHYWRRMSTVGLSVLSILTLSLTAISINTAGAATLPATVNVVVSVNGTLTDPGCPSFASVSPTPSVFGDLASALAAATVGQTIYMCSGSYDFTTAPYAPNNNVTITKAVTIDGTNWNNPPAANIAIDPTTQSVITGGNGIKVQVAGVNINGVTLDTSTGIKVRSNIVGAGDQGEPNVTISNSFFSEISTEDGDIHIGLGQDGAPTDVTVLDAGDTVTGNVFDMGTGFENQAVELSDTTGASITNNIVTYAANDDSSLTALWLDGLDQAATVSGNTLSGGGIDSEVNATPFQGDPKSGIKVIDSDLVAAGANGGDYGNGCSSQVITDNTISGFVYGISMISTGYNANGSLCPVGPTNFTVSNNTISNSRVYGIYLSGTTGGTVSGNVTTGTDTQTCANCTPALTAGQYDYFDTSGTPGPLTNTWSNNSGTGTSSPSGINEKAYDTITFNSEGGSAVSPVSGTDGTTITLPAAPTYAGHTFNGWFAASSGGTALTSPYTLAGSTTLYAQWTVVTDTITFNSQGGSAVGSMSGPDGSTITLPAAPTYAGHTFNGWFAASSGGTALTSPYTLAGSTTLYAQWTTVATTTTTTIVSATTTTTTVPATTTTTVPATTTTTVPPTTTTTVAPKPSVTIPTSLHFLGTKVFVVVHCARARCAGILQLTKKIRVKLEIGHTGKFHFVTENLLLGKTSYVTGTGTAKKITIVLKGASLKFVESFGGHKFSAFLTFTSAGGTKHETVTFIA